MHAPVNIIHIMADDLGYADLGCMGARDAHNQPVDLSPNVDRLAREGILYTNGYANSPVCSPTRFALMTGRWQYRLRGAAEEPLAGFAVGDKVLGLPPSHPSLPSLLRKAGYATALVGKWHLGYPPHFGARMSGYDEFFGYLSGGVDYFSHTNLRGVHDLWHNDEPAEREGYLTDLLTEAATAFIDQQDARRGFLLSLHYSAPHWPWLTREDKHESARIKSRLFHTDGGSLATYQRMIKQMDEGIGDVMHALARRGLSDNTLIVFTSDNGGERYANNWPFNGQKMDLLEGGIRVPLVARWPAGIRAGQISDVPNLTMDWTATMLDVARVSADPGYPLDGISLAPGFNDPDWNPARDLMWRTTHRRQRALRREQWKYLAMDEHEYLFDIGKDPRERANLAAREPEVMAALRSVWQQWDASLPPIPGDAKSQLGYTAAEIPKSSY